MGCQSSQEVIPYNPQDRSIQMLPLGIDQFLAKSQFFQIEKIGDDYFKQGKYLQAISAYKKAIESGYSIDFEIAGLGNFDIETYNFEWWTYKWYDEQRTTGKFKGNMFDALSLCYSRIKESNVEELEKGVVWYEDMLSEKQTYELYMGYANILYNKYLYDPALKAYNKVIALRPSLVNTYVSIMFLHEFKRVEKPKAIAFANTVLSKDPDNMYAYFVLGKNQKDVDQKIKKLQEAAQKYPFYIRLVNEVGLSYGGKKDHKMAIFWYKKCLVLAGEFYAQGYNNVAFRTEMLQDYPQALDYYYRAVQIDPMYKQAFSNAIKLYNKLNFTDDDIIKKMKEYPKMDEFNFYYYLGLAYYDMGGKQINNALNWYKRAEAINPKSFNIYNSMGLAYDSQQKYDQGEKCYLKSMSLNPKYKYAPYNLGLLYKHKGEEDKAVEWYHKAIENDPNYHPPYNNLANIYRDKQEYKKAIELYRKGTEVNSTYTLSYCNMAICLLKQEMYQDAFNALARAKELLPTDNNGLSEANKNFLKENIAKFDIQGDRWRKTGSIGLEQKEKLQSLIKSFESNFKMLYSGQTTFKRSEEVVLNLAILQIIRLIHQDQFQLTNIDQIFTLIKHVFQDDQEYFHIIPQIFIQYFYNSSFIKKKPILDVEAKLFSIIKDFSSKEASLLVPAQGSAQSNTIHYKMKNFNPPKDFKVNLFKDTSYFHNYEVLYSEIDNINKSAQKHLVEYIGFVDAIRKRSNGIPYGANMKMPKRADQQFKVILRILQKMFKKELTQERVKSIISKIDKQVRATQGKVTLINIVHEIMEVWTKEITLILQQRGKAKVETTCAISDLLRGKIMFHTVGDLERAIEACDKLCFLNGYNILQLDNRLSKPQTQDVVLKIQVGQAVCELQLAMKQDESKYHFIHSIYEIERSPLGCIFGSYLFMSKGFNYPLLANCKDIADKLKDRTDGKDKTTLEAVNFIIKALEEN